MRFKVEVIGDIAVLKPPYGVRPEIDEAKRLADQLIMERSYIRSVWLATSPVGTVLKVRGLAHLAGEPRTVTVYKEHGCSFVVDIAKDFLSPRLSYEHIRVAKLIRDGEVVVNMFAGVGLFSVIAARHARPLVVHSIDINPDAYNRMVNNIVINDVANVVIPHLGDAGQVIESRINGVADRVLMPLPDLAVKYLPYALRALKGEGFVHIYLHVHANKGEDPLAKAVALVDKAMKDLGASWEPMGVREVRMVGPRFYQVVVDAHVQP